MSLINRRLVILAVCFCASCTHHEAAPMKPMSPAIGTYAVSTFSASVAKVAGITSRSTRTKILYVLRARRTR